MIKRITNSNQSRDYKLLNASKEEFFKEFNKIYTKDNSFRKYRGTAIQTDKGENNLYFPTKYPSKYYEEDKNGNIKDLPWEWIYKDFESVERAAKDYMQIQSGRNHYERWVQVLDCDHDFTSTTIKNLLNEFHRLCIPEPSCIIVNPKTNHYQVHWMVDNPYIKPYTGNFPQVLHNTRHSINLLFNGDDRFTGGFIKNPFYEGLNVTWFSHKPISRFELDDKIEAAFVNENNGISYRDFKKLQKKLKNGEKKLKNHEKSTVIKLSSIEAKSRSRHMESLEHSRTDAFAYMRSHKGELSKEFLKERVEYWQWQVVNEIYDPERTTIEDDYQINSIVNSVYNWCMDNYTPTKGGSNCNNFNAEYGSQIRRLQGLIKFFTINHLKETGLTTKAIAEKLGMTDEGVRANVRKNKGEDLEEGFNLIKTFYLQHKDSCDETSLRLCSFIDELFTLIGYEFTEDDMIEAKETEYITVDYFSDRLFEIFADATIEHSNGYVEYDSKYMRKVRPKL